METATVESISKALRLPQPFLNESNRAFKQLETWQQLATLVATQRVQIRPLGFYWTPNSIAIYVFECTMGDLSSARRYNWKIYRRYQHFKNYIAHSSKVLDSGLVHIPKLSQGYYKLFRAQDCLVELFKWLEGVVQSTQAYWQEQHEMREKWDNGQLVEVRQQRLTQFVIQVTHEIPTMQKWHRSNDVTLDMTQNSTDGLQVSKFSPSTTGLQRRRRKFSLKSIEQQGDSRLNVRRFDKAQALSVIMLSCFLFAGANCPFPHAFRNIPSFALAVQEVNVHIKQNVYPLKLSNSATTRASLGIRLRPSYARNEQYFGATVAKFLRPQEELDPGLVDVQVGAQLVQVNGIDISTMPFDQALIHLRRVGVSLRLKFLYDARINRQWTSFTTLSSSGRSTMFSSEMRCEVMSSNTDTIVAEKPPIHRSVNVDAPQSTYTALLGNLFGPRGVSQVPNAQDTAWTDLLNTLADVPWKATQHMQLHAVTFDSWDDIHGASRDLISRGFYSDLSSSLLSELSEKRHAATTVFDCFPKYDSSDSNKSHESSDRKTKAQGVWSTATGPMGLRFGACTLCGIEAVMLESAPVSYSSRAEQCVSEKRLRKGYVLTAINHQSTFGASIAIVLQRLRSACRPTTLCFRWFDKFSPFLATNIIAYDGKQSSRDVLVDKCLDCMAEAQADLSHGLELALVENATVRDQLNELQDAHREVQLAHECVAQREHLLQVTVEQCNLKIAKLTEEVEYVRRHLDQSQRRTQEAEAAMAVNILEYDALRSLAQESARTRLAEHQAQVVKESNRSIEIANRLAESRAQKRLETAVTEIQRTHDRYVQKLAEEHSVEVKSLMQQVAVWQHQVEVLTEAEKRNYAALVSTGVNPYDTYQRCRFGAMSSELPFADRKTNDLEGSQRKQAETRDSSTCVTPSAVTVTKGRSGIDNVRNRHVLSDAIDRSTSVNNATFWDRMVALIE